MIKSTTPELGLTDIQKQRIADYNDAQLEMARLEFDLKQTQKYMDRQEVIVQQLCDLAYGHDFANDNNGADTDECLRCGYVIYRPEEM